MRLGFVVEGSTDADVVRVLVDRLVPDSARRPKFVIARGRSEIARRADHLVELAGAGTECVLVLVDLDGDDPRTDELVAIEDALRRAAGPARVLYAVQAIEAWLLAGESRDGSTETIAEPKRLLSELMRRQGRRKGYVPRTDARRLARTLDIDRATTANDSLAEFARVVRGCRTAQETA